PLGAGRLTTDRRGAEGRAARPCAFEPPHPEGSSTLTTRPTAGFSRRQVMRFGLFAAAGALLAACGQAAAPTEAPKASDTSAPKPTEAPKPAAAEPTKPAAAEPTKPAAAAAPAATTAPAAAAAPAKAGGTLVYWRP